MKSSILKRKVKLLSSSSELFVRLKYILRKCELSNKKRHRSYRQIVKKRSILYAQRSGKATRHSVIKLTPLRIISKTSKVLRRRKSSQNQVAIVMSARRPKAAIHQTATARRAILIPAVVPLTARQIAIQ